MMGIESESDGIVQNPDGAGPAQNRTMPLNEVAFGTRFIAPDFDLVQFGQYYEIVKSIFKERQMVAPIAGPQLNGYGGPGIQVPTFPRLWFTAGSRLIQLQVDRYIYNWRRLDDSSEEYPGFEMIFSEFQTRWREFLSFSDDAFKIPLTVAELSLTYVNQIHDDKSIGTPMFAFRKSDFDLPSPDLWVSQLRIPFAEENMKITVGARPAIFLATQESVSQLDLTVESITAPEGFEHTVEWFERAHKLVHRTFKALVGLEWRQKWGFASE